MREYLGIGLAVSESFPMPQSSNRRNFLLGKGKSGSLVYVRRVKAHTKVVWDEEYGLPKANLERCEPLYGTRRAAAPSPVRRVTPSFLGN